MLLKLMIAVNTPKIKIVRNLKFSFLLSKKFVIELINLSYIPKLTATIAPDTPGIILAIPIRNALKNKFIVFTIKVYEK